MKNILIALILCVPTIVNAQIDYTNQDRVELVSFRTKPFDLNKMKVEGSPYLGGDYFKPGQVSFNNEIKLRGLLRYNAYSSEIEIKKGEKEYSAILKRADISAKIANDSYEIFPFVTSEGLKRTGYFIVLNEGVFKLLYKPEIRLREGRAPETSYDKAIAPKYIDASSYYIKVGEDPAKKFYLNKKNYYKIFDKEKIKKIVEDLGLNVKKREDSITLFKALNS